MPTEPPISPHALALSDSLRMVLKQLVRELRRESTEADQGLAPMQAMLMVIIQEQPGIGVAELARLENVRGATMSGHVKALEAAGMVERSAPDPQDRRRSGLQLTERGVQAIKALRDRRRDWMARRIARLTPQQLDALAAAIGPLNEIAKP
ncbi:MarR family transcriptional regulator [Pseudoduganella ginsengisoli]|uniref:MarR family transcriptional regulator n=1 Tax=Pseudoduganella ginsengisoli TaxID=1462440 RepID=A0A6L6Q4P5_9BURK|nr:MarR family transcriptional regulator [Pseudoduganella ginsengisoli]MTW04409.1 MarR family transcriptional regulator [Pseudoduganella ginsengisoli]